MPPPKTPWSDPCRYRVRLVLNTGRVRVGGYIGSQNGTIYIADELSGEIHSLSWGDIQSHDIVPYPLSKGTK